MSGERQTILMAPEAEAIIEHFEVFQVKDIGSQRWAQQHENLQRINMQAILHASQDEDEFVKEYLVTYEKIPALIKDLIATEVWKQKVFPKFSELELEPKSSFPIYIVLLHECTTLNILETVMYHKDACEAADDLIIDLMDYCYRKLTALIARCEENDDKELDEEEDKELTIDSVKTPESNLSELQNQFKTIEFNIATKALAVLRFIADHSTSLSLSVLSRLLNTHDVPLLVTQLIETAPWTRKRKGKLEKYVELNWQTVDERDRFRLTKIEGQMWLTLFPLLMREECQRKYELDTYKKNCLLKLRAYMNEMLLDQLPVLVEMQRYLEQLSMMEPPAVKKELLLEQMPEIKEDLLRINEGKWGKIAKKQMKTFFNPSKADLQTQARRLAEAYDLDTLENFIMEPPKCVLCGEPASKRCSRCQQEWYCRRECQVSHWKKHKKACDLYIDSKKKAEEMVRNAAEIKIS